jgi:predicted nuclease of predicted toxin-antitoxin system
VRFLLDQNLSPLLVDLLREEGHDVIHVRDLHMSRSSDVDIMRAALADRRTVISSDTDFGELLARTNASAPSVVLFRRQGQRRASELAALLMANLEAVVDDLDAGAVVVIDADRVRVRLLPLRPV